MTAASGCTYTRVSARVRLCTSVSTEAGGIGGRKETNWSQKAGHSPSAHPLHPPPSLGSFRCSAGFSSARWLIPFCPPLSLPLPTPFKTEPQKCCASHSAASQSASKRSFVSTLLTAPYSQPPSSFPSFFPSFFSPSLLFFAHCVFTQ